MFDRVLNTGLHWHSGYNHKFPVYIRTYGSRYSRMDQVKFVEDRLSAANFTWSILEYFVPHATLVMLMIHLKLSLQS